MDFIEGLPLSSDFNSMLVVVDRLTKYAIFIECHKTDRAMELAMLFLKHILPNMVHLTTSFPTKESYLSQSFGPHYVNYSTLK